MTKNDFVKQLTSFFFHKGFSCQNKHYYKEVSSDVILVFGMQTSHYGESCYLEYGYCIKSINRYLPYPKFNQLNLNCGRIMTGMGKAIAFEKIDETTMGDLLKTIDGIVNDMINLVGLGKDAMIQYFLSGRTNQSWYILGDETVDYFGLPKEAFLFHFVKEL